MCYRYDGDWLKRSILYEVISVRGIGRLRITQNQVVEKEGYERVWAK